MKHWDAHRRRARWVPIAELADPQIGKDAFYVDKAAKPPFEINIIYFPVLFVLHSFVPNDCERIPNNPPRKNQD